MKMSKPSGQGELFGAYGRPSTPSPVVPEAPARPPRCSVHPIRLDNCPACRAEVADFENFIEI
jgi:hypothetical protein